MNQLSPEQAKKLVLSAQKLPPAKELQKSKALDLTQSTIEHLGYIQIDTISVVERAHDHTLWNRNPLYQSTDLDQLVAEKKVFEYWSHAAAFLPMKDYRFSLPKKMALANGTQKHWHKLDKSLMDAVLKRIETEGPLMAKDFEDTRPKTADWTSKPAKQALENLFMQGDLMITKRQNFHKVFDLKERVLPAGLDTSMPTETEYARHLIISYLRANGLGLVEEMVYLLKKVKPLVSKTAKAMLSAGELVQVSVGENVYYALPGTLEALDQRLPQNALKILSPFDNLLIQRKRTKALFDFDYLIECYVPQAKRQYGYFSLPILWNGDLVARVDCKNDRKTKVMHLLHLAIEPKVVDVDAFAHDLLAELKLFLSFNNCVSLTLHKVSPSKLEGVLKKAIKQIDFT